MLFLVVLAIVCLAQPPRPPDIAAQRAAMKKLDFLVGKWSGEARGRRGPAAQPTEVVQTEEAQYKLDGLLLLIEGVGRKRSDGSAFMHAVAIVSYDDEKASYRMRAYNDGRHAEVELKLLDVGKGLRWGSTAGQAKYDYVLRINEKNEWTESAEVTVGSQPPIKFWELAVRRQN
jgi:hypothetical protein